MIFEKDFDVREVYVDESLYVIDSDGVNVNPFKLYKRLGSTTSVGARRRPVYGILYRDRKISWVIRLLSVKHNILSIDLSVLKKRKKLSSGYLGRLSDVVQLSWDLYPEVEVGESISAERVDWLDDVEIVCDDGLILVLTKENLLHSLMGYMYASRFIIDLLGEWILFNPVDYLGMSSTSDIRIVPVDENRDEVRDDYDKIAGFLIECRGKKYLEYL